MMKSLTNILSTLWLVTALVLAPLSTLSATDFVDPDACPMHTTSGTDSAKAMSDSENSCPQCSNHDCSAGDCGHKGCTATLQLAFPASNLSFPLRSTDSPSMTILQSHLSLNAPPLLRPPV